jgi:RNA polymerase sigma factor (sigma-70 family)
MDEKDINRTKFEDGFEIDHGAEAKRYVQLSKKAWTRIPEPEYNEASENATYEQLMIRQALKRLTTKQVQVWELWNYEKLTQDEIAEKLKISQPVVAKHIKAIEKKIVKYCQSHMQAYEAMKETEQRQDE